jgi:nucleotide-binding universal stress UspA family protein
MWLNDPVLVGLDVELRHTEEPPAQALSRIATDEHADWIVVGRHAGPRPASRIVGDLLRCSDRPVTVAP